MILPLFLAYLICFVTAEQPYVHVDPQELTIVKGQSASIDFTYHGELKNKIELLLHNSPELSCKPNKIGFDSKNNVSKVHIHGLAVTSRAFVDVGKCREDVQQGPVAKCDLSTERVFATVKVVHSNFIAILVYICGFIFFIAWSISFYPQIILNFRRKSVIGLNFDFLILNVIGFSCYTVYNFMFYFNKNVQELYLSTHPRNLIPVLINDVIFAGHALFVCLVTGFQCFIYERGNQRVSYICRGWSSLLVIFALVSVIIALFQWINWLQFIYYLSYVKMAVTLSKYLPQAILNYKRKSTVGWSIGNVLLDFAGGLTDVFQMVLQALNTNDWSVFSGNPVKVGIGSTSIFFDIFFIVQHYVLYRQREAFAEVWSIDKRCGICIEMIRSCASGSCRTAKLRQLHSRVAVTSQRLLKKTTSLYQSLSRKDKAKAVQVHEGWPDDITAEMSTTKKSLAPDFDIEKLHIIEWDHLDLWRFYPMALASSWTIRSLLYPTQVIKARLQLQQQNTVYRGMTHAFVDIFRKEGFFALYRGFWVTVPQISATFIYSGVYERLRKELADRANITSPSLVSPLAGAAASLCIELIYVPTDIISQYMMIDKKSGSFTGSSSGAIINCLRADKLENRLTLGLRVIRAVYKVDGLYGFYRGFWSSCFVYVPSSMVFWSSYYASLNLLKKARDFSYSWWNKKAVRDSTDQQVVVPQANGNLLLFQAISGSISGIFSAICTNPLEVLRIRIQVHRTSYLETFKRLVNIEGFRVFTKGLAPRIISNSIYSSLIMVGYESVKRMSVLPEYKDSVVW